MSDLRAPILTASIAAIGWLIVYIINSLREDRIKQLQIIIDQTSKQVNEFYAPLISLTEQVDSFVNVFEQAKRLNQEKSVAITDFSHLHFFFPLHDQIRSILSSKLYLMERSQIPPNLKTFLGHISAEKAIFEMNKNCIDTSEIRYPEYPEGFNDDLRIGCAIALARYDDAVKEIRIPWLGFKIDPSSLAFQGLKRRNISN